MHHSSFDDFEQQLAPPQSGGAPPALRRVVLDDVNRELRAARWDRRLARVAVVLLVVGVGLNGALALSGGSPRDPRPRQFAVDANSKSLVETAIVVAKATNVETGRQFARQIAALNGRELSDEELASIDAATTPGRG